jgi:glutaredoxin 3
MPKVLIYSKKVCPYCDAAKNLFRGKNVEFEEILLDGNPEKFVELKKKTGWMTVPQIFVGEQFLGGYTDIAKLDQEGKLDPLLASK